METGYVKELEAEGTDEAEARIENIDELLSKVVSYEESEEHPTLSGFLEEVALVADIDSLEDDSDYVVLMTLHSAKGLEFPKVYLAGMEDGLFPSYMSITSDDSSEQLEEERRLAYVAFTRAKKQLFLSDSYGYSYVLDKIKTTSRFIKELPEDCIEDVGAKPRNTFSSDVDTFSGSDFLSMHSDMVQHRPQESSGYARQAERKLSDVRIADSFDGAPIINEDRKPKKKGKIRKGDLVHHESFGDGVVIKLEEQLATIAFEQKFGIRKIKIDHPALSKK